MTGALATTSGSALWYFSRATGVVTLGLLTLVVLLGVLTRGGKPLPGLPSFAVAGLHRNASLLVLVMLAAAHQHRGPGQLRPDQLGGCRHPLRFRLPALLAGPRRAVLRPAAGGHRDEPAAAPPRGARCGRPCTGRPTPRGPWRSCTGLGTGTDASEGWMLAFTAVCVGVVVLAVLWRVVDLSSAPVRRKAVAVGAGVAAPPRTRRMDARRAARPTLGQPRGDAHVAAGLPGGRDTTSAQTTAAPRGRAQRDRRA